MSTRASASQVYLGLLVSQWSSLEGGFGSLSAVARLFENRYALLAGWVHYLAFDLFIGSWQVRDAGRHEIRQWLVVPCLLFTLMFGPVGLLLYLAIRIGVKRTLAITVES